MSQVKRIASQLKRAYQGEAWHGPSIKELLADVNAETAASKPSSSSHSIWEIVLHIITWERAVKRRLAGEIFTVPQEEDWPEVKDTSESAWRETLQTLEENHLQLRAAVKILDESRLDEMVADQPYTIYFMLHGVIQHDIYHAGQISLLKKIDS